MKEQPKPSISLRAAIYARVSTEQQAQQSTIASQVEALRERLHADGHVLEDDLCFLDDGYSGSTLVRPGLERLRDVAWAGGFTRLYVHSPDRLARKYAWQVLLVEELQRGGIEIVFLNRTIGVSPEEDLLLQMQGMIAEYERAKIMERSRRGKRHAARRGSINVLAAAPHGYRYLSKHAGGGQAQYQVVAEEAGVVRQIFEWVGRDRLSLREVGRRLRQQQIPSAKGKAWHVFTVRKLLTNPAYKGEAVFGKTRVGERKPRLRPAKGQPEQPRNSGSRYPGAVADQITIAVPALVSAELFAAVADQLEENRRHYRQQSQSPGYLLQGLLMCDGCGYGWYGKGITRFTKNDRTPYPYYRCTGMDSFRHGGTKVCPHRAIRLDRLDAAVWADVSQVLQNPEALREEFERRLSGNEDSNIDLEQIHKQVKSVQRGISRLIDGYEEGLLEKQEFEPRVARLRERLARLQQQAATVQNLAAQRQELRQVLGQLEDFATQVRRGLDQAEFAKRREIIRCLVKAIKIEAEHVRITYRVSPRPFVKAPSGGTFRQHCHRRVRGHPARTRREGGVLSLPPHDQGTLRSGRGCGATRQRGEGDQGETRREVGEKGRHARPLTGPATFPQGIVRNPSVPDFPSARPAVTSCRRPHPARGSDRDRPSDRRRDRRGYAHRPRSSPAARGSDDPAPRGRNPRRPGPRTRGAGRMGRSGVALAPRRAPRPRPPLRRPMPRRSLLRRPARPRRDRRDRFRPGSSQEPLRPAARLRPERSPPFRPRGPIAGPLLVSESATTSATVLNVA